VVGFFMAGPGTKSMTAQDPLLKAIPLIIIRHSKKQVKGKFMGQGSFHATFVA